MAGDETDLAELVARRRRELGIGDSGSLSGHSKLQGAVPLEADTLQIALGYARRGWRVLPLWRPAGKRCTCRKKATCDRPGKHPRTRNGCKSATTDPAQIRAWKWETANIAIATGPPSGLLVLDIDPRNAGDKTLAELQRQLGKLPAGPAVITGGNGWHRYFAYPGCVKIGCPTLGPGVEVKGAGGYVVAPPSLHVSGRRYRWQCPPETVAVPALPPPWIEHIAGKGKVNTEAQELQEAQEIQEPQETQGNSSNRRVWLRGRHVRKFSAEIEAAIEYSLPIAKGNRNRALFELARRMKALPQFAHARFEAVEHIFAAWHHRGVAAGVIGTEPVEVTLGESRYCWEKVRYPAGQGIFAEAIRRAPSEVILPESSDGLSEQARRVLQVAAWLEHHNGGVVYLGARQTARIAGLSSSKSGWSLLKHLVFEGYLEISEPSIPQQRKATCFRVGIPYEIADTE